jgi:hypothetical protein
MPKTVECPNCHHFNAVPMAGIGQYVTCDKCGCKYYVYVPPLAETTGGPVETAAVMARAAASHETAELERPAHRPHHLEGGVMFRQESLLATIHEDLVDLRRRITVACLLFVVGCTVVVTLILTR